VIKCSIVLEEHIVLNWFRWVLKKCSGRKYVSFIERFEGVKASHSYRGAEFGIGLVPSQ
jgi:hypothetical protein